MGIIEKIWLKWRTVDPDNRRHIKQTATWVTAYLVCVPAMLYFMLMAIYDVQTEAAIRSTVPEQVNNKNFNTWLAKQQKEGKFMDEKPR